MSEKSKSVTRLDRVIVDAYTKTAFFKVRADSFGIDRLQFDFVNMVETQDDESPVENAVKMTANQTINIYVNIYKAVALANDILSGRLPTIIERERKAALEKDKNTRYFNAVWEDFGGMSNKTLRFRNLDKRPDLQVFRDSDQAVSRVLRLSPGANAPYVFSATQCAGEEVARGAIRPLRGAKMASVNVGFEADKLKEFAYGVLTEWDAFIKTQYMRGVYKSTWTGNNRLQNPSDYDGPPLPPSQNDFGDEPL